RHSRVQEFETAVAAVLGNAPPLRMIKTKRTKDYTQAADWSFRAPSGASFGALSQRREQSQPVNLQLIFSGRSFLARSSCPCLFPRGRPRVQLHIHSAFRHLDAFAFQ